MCRFFSRLWGRRRRAPLPPEPAIDLPIEPIEPVEPPVIPVEPGPVKGYPTIGDYTDDELRRADYLVRALVLSRLRPGHAPGPVDPLEEEPGRPHARPHQLPAPLLSQWDACIHAAAALRTEINNRLRASTDRVRHRVARLTQGFELRPAERDAAFLALLGQTKPQAAAWFAQLQHDDRRTDPSAGLVADLLAPVYPHITAGDLFALARPWLNLGVCRLGDRTGAEPLARQAVRLSDRAAAFLYGGHAPDPELAPFAAHQAASAEWSEQFLAAELLTRLRVLADWWQAQHAHQAYQAQRVPKGQPVAGAGLTLVFHGPYGAGQPDAAGAFCHQNNLPLLTVDTATAVRHPDDWPRLLAAAYREAWLTGAAVYWRGAEVLFDKDRAPADGWELLARRAGGYAGVTFVETATAAVTPRAAGGPRHRYVQLDFFAPAYPLRKRIWWAQLSQQAEQPGADRAFYARLAKRLANAFQLTQGQITDAFATAAGLLAAHPPAPRGDQTDDQFQRARERAQAAALTEACRLQSARQLVAFARRIPPRPGARWGSLVVPPATRRQLAELDYRGRAQGKVYHEFGFDRRLRLGKGLVCLFVGPSGTGKTMAAAILAGKRGVDLYKVDLSAVVSKYVGETERHLAQVFADAEAANAFLFFDEADCLFGKRGEVNDARDRWANMEVNYLLQRVEEFTGTVVLATNLRQNIDEAFLRRIHAVVEFPFPAPADRYKILAGLLPLPRPAPADERAAFEAALWEVANRFPLSGGSLKNVAVDAAFRARKAAPRCPRVHAKQLAAAVGREYQKLGKPITRGDFGDDFYRFVREELFGDPAACATGVRAG